MPDLTTRDITTRDIATRDVGTADIGAAGSTLVYDWDGLSLVASTGGNVTPPSIGDADGNRLVRDWENRFIPVKAEETRVFGARRAENLFNYSENLNGWAAVAGITINDATTFTCTSGTSKAVYQIVSFPSDFATRLYRISADIQWVSGDTEVRMVWGSNASSVFTIDGTNRRYSAIGTTAGSGNQSIGIQVYLPGSETVVKMTNFMLEDVTGQTNTNPSEYVSTGAATGSELILAQSAAQWVTYGNNTATDAGADGVLLTYVNSTLGGDLYFDVDEGVCAGDQTLGKTYVLTGQAKVNTGNVRIGVLGTVGTLQEDVTSTDWVDFVLAGVCDAPTVFLIRLSLAVGETINIRNLSLKEADHGWGVDGVKYFSTLNANTVSSNVVTEATGSALTTIKGYTAEGAATELSGYSADITNWTKSNGATVTKDAVGLSGASNEAFTVTDSNASARSDIYCLFATTSSTDTYYVIHRIGYDASPSVYPMIGLEIQDVGTSTGNYICFDPSDGSYAQLTDSYFNDGSVVSVTRRQGPFDHWEVIQSVADNGTGNTRAAPFFAPAYNTNGSATANATATGSTVIASAELYKDNYSHSPILTTGGTTKTRLADTLATLPPDWNEVDAAGSLEFTVTPYFLTASGSGWGMVGPVSNTASRAPVFFRGTTTSFRGSDGTNIVSLGSAWASVGQSVAVKARWGSSTFRYSADGVSCASTTYDGSFSPVGSITLFKDMALAGSIKDLKIYNEDKGDAWLEE